MVFFVLIYKFKNNTIPSEEIMTIKLHMPRHWCRELTCKILFARGHVRTVTRVIVIREYVLYMLTRGVVLHGIYRVFSKNGYTL